MEAGFRASMSWLHTWAGVVLGGLLFAIFWMGTLSVFDREIDRWMMPMTRLPIPDRPASLDALRPAIQEAAAAGSPFLTVVPPSDRQAFRLVWRQASQPAFRYLDPATAAALPDPGTWAGTGFIYPFHYMLHIRVGQLGMWLVGLAGMAMMTLCVSGVVIHRKLLADFFTFRVRNKPRRLILDLHNVVGVLGLPFHFVITLSGLIIFFANYLPGVLDVAYRGDRQVFFQESLASYSRPKLNRPGGVASLDAMVATARSAWEGEEPLFLVIRHPGDAASFVQIGRSTANQITTVSDALFFDAATGALLQQRAGAGTVTSAQRFIAGLHFIQFRHWTLRWSYFALGLLGCVLIATGYLFWLASRRRRHEQLGLSGVRLVEGLTIGSVSGIVIATFAFFAINRLLPLGMTFLGQERAALEVWTFYLAWLAAFAHAWLRPARAWVEQCWAIGALGVMAVLLNWLTTGDHLVRSVAHRHLWGVGGLDSMLLSGAVVAMLIACKSGHRVAAPPNAGARRVPPSPRAIQE